MESSDDKWKESYPAAVEQESTPKQGRVNKRPGSFNAPEKKTNPTFEATPEVDEYLRETTIPAVDEYVLELLDSVNHAYTRRLSLGKTELPEYFHLRAHMSSHYLANWVSRARLPNGEVHDSLRDATSLLSISAMTPGVSATQTFSSRRAALMMALAQHIASRPQAEQERLASELVGLARWFFLDCLPVTPEPSQAQLDRCISRDTKKSSPAVRAALRIAGLPKIQIDLFMKRVLSLRPSCIREEMPAAKRIAQLAIDPEHLTDDQKQAITEAMHKELVSPSIAAGIAPKPAHAQADLWLNIYLQSIAQSSRRIALFLNNSNHGVLPGSLRIAAGVAMEARLNMADRTKKFSIDYEVFDRYMHLCPEAPTAMGAGLSLTFGRAAFDDLLDTIDFILPRLTGDNELAMARQLMRVALYLWYPAGSRDPDKCAKEELQEHVLDRAKWGAEKLAIALLQYIEIPQRLLVRFESRLRKRKSRHKHKLSAGTQIGQQQNPT